ncbi:hypothetical protein [Marinobacter sp.]|uniref:hypothetical protein n=1 Tax=Marinobacter sp. TaxID=50741 RepID=UPI00384AA98F
MTEIPQGLKYYLLLLVPGLIEELNDYGVSVAARENQLDEHDVEKAFFAARSIQRRLPASPEEAEAEVWLDIMEAIHAIRLVLDVLEKEAFEEVAALARKATSDIARADVKAAYERKRKEGEVDFRLHGLTRAEPVEDGEDPVIRESFLIKREGRYREFIAFGGSGLQPAERVIINDAKILAHSVMELGKEDSRIDAILAMGTVLAEILSVRANSRVPETIREQFGRMAAKATMALGAIVYREQYEALKASLNLRKLDLDL